MEASINTKDMIINNILCVMAAQVQADILKTLDNAIRHELYDFDVTPMQTGIAVYDTSNDRMLQIFAANKKLENLKEDTIKQYVLYNRKLLEYTGKRYDQVTTEDVKFWLAEYSMRVCSNTVANAKRYFSSFYGWCHENGYITKNIIKPINNIKTDPPKKEHMTPEEVEAVRDSCQDIRELALVDLLLSTGIRVGELTALKIEDVDFLRGQITLRSEKSRKFRTIYLDARAKKHLVEFLHTRTDNSPFLFPHKRKNRALGYPPALKKGGIEMILHGIGDRAGLRKNCTVHLFRRTFATTLFDRGVKLEYIKELLGHASTSTTEHHYVSISQSNIAYEFNRAMAA